jgi:hypothetical protein
MDYKDYMVMNCQWQKNLGKDEDTHMPSFGVAVDIKCFSYGKNIFIRQDTSSTTVSAKAYIVTDLVKVGDKIDGQVVKSVNNVPDFDGTVPLFECLTWYD